MALGVGVWMATWWMTEVVPIPATSLLPLIVFPVAGLQTMQAAAAPYANPLIFLFMGGFMMALGMERCGLHRRIALNILARVGTRPAHVVGGFMVACAALSMWVTNTATSMMMLPIGMSVIALAREKSTTDAVRPLGIALMLGIAYACTIGGLGTLIGTIPNALAAAFILEQYGVEIGFGQWMLVGVPLVLLGLPVAWWVLTRKLEKAPIHGLDGMLADELASLGPASRDERAVAVVFAGVVALWLSRPFLVEAVPGVSDTGIALLGALALFVIPSASAEPDSPWSSRFLLDWPTARQIPWGILVLFGGGLSLAALLSDTGFAVWLGGLVSAIDTWHPLLVMTVVTGLVIFLTELTSNTATTAAFLPVMASVAIAAGENPFLFVIPATIAASAAFMLPVATPPNAIVYGSGEVEISDMARAGLVLNVAFTVLVSAMTYVLVQLVFDVQPGILPDWGF